MSVITDIHAREVLDSRGHIFVDFLMMAVPK